MKRFLFSIIANLAALWLAVHYINGFSINGGFKEYLIAGLILAILNLVLKPIIKLR